MYKHTYQRKGRWRSHVHRNSVHYGVLGNRNSHLPPCCVENTASNLIYYLYQPSWKERLKRQQKCSDSNGGKKSFTICSKQPWLRKTASFLGASPQYHVFSLLQTLLSSCRPATHSMTVCCCLNTYFQGSRTLLIFVSSLSALLTRLQRSVTWAPGRARPTNPRENHVSSAAMTAFWKEHVPGLSWAIRGSHGTGSIFPLKRLQVQLRVLNSTVWYGRHWLLCSARCFCKRQSRTESERAGATRSVEAPKAWNTLMCSSPEHPRASHTSPGLASWPPRGSTQRRRCASCAWQHLAVTDPGKPSSSLLLKSEHWLMLAPLARLVLGSISIAKSKCSVDLIYTSHPSAGNFIIRCWQRSASQCKIYWHLSNYEMYPFNSLMVLTGPGKRCVTRLSN